MRSTPTLSRGMGAIHAKLLQQAVRHGVEVGEHLDQIREGSDLITRHVGRRAFTLAKITGHALLTGQTNRWEYDWTEVEITSNGIQDLSGGFTSAGQGKAFNLCELQNNGTAAEGPGWDLATAPAGFSIKPITQAVVMLWAQTDTTNAQRWFFLLGNVLDGTCT